MTNFDLTRRGLDYPPLSAFHMQSCGYVAQLINPHWVALNVSRGIESPEHQIFMRSTVILSDLVVLVPAAFFVKKHFGRFAMISLLFNPCLILVDHGHFQYNGVSLGLAILAAFSVTANSLMTRSLGCVYFTAALFYKQMALYHAFPFFFILLGQAWKKREVPSFIKEVAIYGSVVLMTSLFYLTPFLKTDDPLAQLAQIAHRLFPFARGLFEDKVASFWCTLHSIVKLKNILSPEIQLKLATGTTLVSGMVKN